ncbi:MAG: Ig-like domain-containing protein [Verrucomicrobiota bacterium]|nr:Ig-like domain-containing protein [Verrucomicrobiota bacterium]
MKEGYSFLDMKFNDDLKRCFQLFTAATCIATGSVEAADVQVYEVLKGRFFEQTGTAQPSPTESSFYFEAFVTPSDFDLIQDGDVTVRTPAGATLVLESDFFSGEFRYVQTFATENTLDASFGDGNYTFSITSENDIFTAAQLNLQGAIPSAPHLSNFNAAQAINPSEDFTLTWNALSGGTANDEVFIEIFDANGESIYGSDAAGEGLNGTATSFLIPAGTLSSGVNFSAKIAYLKISERDTTEYPGAIGTAGYFAETTVPLTVATSTPQVVSVNPANQSFNVPTNSPIVLTFSEAMLPTQSIQWLFNNTPKDNNGFIYSWGNNGTQLTINYTPGFPPNAFIAYILNPSPEGPNDFKDLAGNRLENFTGFFQTGNSGTGSTNNPCEGGGQVFTNGNYNTYFLSKFVTFLQTNNSAPVFDTDDGAMVFASYTSSSNSTASQVSVSFPQGTNLTLTNFFGRAFQAFHSYPSQAALDLAVPTGDYVFNVNGSGGNQTATITFTANGTPNVPRVLNLQELAGMNVSNDFTLRWEALVNPTTNKSISLTITDDTGTTFTAPDFCNGITLTNTDTSIVIPAGTFKTNGHFTGSISFFVSNDSDIGAIPDGFGQASVIITTEFEANLDSGGEPRTLNWTTITRTGPNTIEFRLAKTGNGTITVQGSTDLMNWTENVPFTTAPNGDIVVTVNTLNSPYKFYRARMD